MTEKLDTGRREFRRNWARLAFAYVLGTGALTFYQVLFSEHRQGVADAVAAVWPMLGASWSVCTIVFCTYLGVSHLDNRLRKTGES